MIYCIYVYCIYTNRCMLSISRFGVPHEFFCYPYHLSGDDIDIYRLLLPNLCFFLNMEKIHDISKKTPQNIVWPIKNPLKQFGHLSIMTPNDLRGSHNSNNNGRASQIHHLRLLSWTSSRYCRSGGKLSCQWTASHHSSRLLI